MQISAFGNGSHRRIGPEALDLIEEMYHGHSERYPEERFDVGDGWIRFLPSANDGFDVGLSISASEDEYLVTFDGWHDHFDDREEALDWFALGLSEECRLKIIAKGGQPFRWVVEVPGVEAPNDGGNWASAHIMATFPLIFQRRSTTEYQRNRLNVRSSQSILPSTRSTLSGVPD